MGDIRDVVWRLHSLNKLHKEQEESYKKHKASEQKKILEYLKKRNETTVCVDGIKATGMFPKSIIWDVLKLKKKVPHGVFGLITKKRYTVTDMSGLCEYLKECGVNPKKFKQYISVECDVDEKAIEQLSSMGEFQDEWLEGCYQVVEKDPYIRITELSND